MIISVLQMASIVSYWIAMHYGARTLAGGSYLDNFFIYYIVGLACFFASLALGAGFGNPTLVEIGIAGLVAILFLGSGFYTGWKKEKKEQREVRN